MNTALMRAVRESRSQGKKRLRLQERKRNDTTVMLIGVVVIFFMCQMPAVASHVVWAFYSQTYQQRLPSYVLNEIANFLVTLNSAVNIVPYYFFGRRFREEFCRLFCGRCVSMYARGRGRGVAGEGGVIDETTMRDTRIADHRRSSQYSGYSCTGKQMSTRLHVVRPRGKKTGENGDATIPTSFIASGHFERDEIGLIRNCTDSLLEPVEPNSTATEPTSTSVVHRWPSTTSL